MTNLAAQTALQSAGGASQFQIDLHPQGLGRVSVSVEIGAGGQLSAAFALDRATTTADLAARSGELQRTLQQAGFDVADGALSFSTSHALTQVAGVQAPPPQASNPGAGQGNGQTPAHPGASGAATGQGSQGFGQGARQDASGQSSHRGRAFATAAQVADLADLPASRTSASRAPRGLDIRI